MLYLVARRLDGPCDGHKIDGGVKTNWCIPPSDFALRLPGGGKGGGKGAGDNDLEAKQDYDDDMVVPDVAASSSQCQASSPTSQKNAWARLPAQQVLEWFPSARLRPTMGQR